MLRRVAARAVPWLLAIGTIGGLTYDRIVSDGTAQLERRRDDAIVLARAAIVSHVTVLRDDVRLVSRHAAVKEVLEAPTDDALARLKRLLTLVMDVRGRYDQGRWIDETGQERVRCDRASDDQGIHDVHAVERIRCLPDTALQSKAGRYYVTDASRLEPGSIYVSPLDLNVEDGAVEVPHTPMLRVAAPLRDAAGQHRGIVILNALMQGLLDELRTLRSTVGVDLYLVDGRGNWLVGETPGDAFAFQLGRPDDTMPARYPDTAAPLEGGGPSRVTGTDGAWHLAEIRVGALLGMPAGGPVPVPVLWLAAHTTAQELADVRAAARMTTIPLGLVLAAVTLVFAYRYARLAKDRDLAGAAAIRQAEELARMNEALKEALAQGLAMREQLVDAQKLSSLGLMVAGVAHELNTPVGAALMAATALKKSLDGATDAPVPPARIDTGLRLVLGNLNRVAERIARLRRLAVDRASAERRRFRLRDVVDDVLHDVGHRIKHAHVTVGCAVDEAIELDGYPGPLGQVLENLILNAAFHAFEQRAGRRIEIAAVPDGQHVLITVSDNGKGIAPEHLPHLFDPFFTTRRGEQRMGLGLYLVQRYVTDLLGGHLSVTSTAGEGARFAVLLPLSVDAAAQPPAASPPDAAPVPAGAVAADPP